jgi:hypothetical protein
MIDYSDPNSSFLPNRDVFSLRLENEKLKRELTEARALLNALAENHKMTITELHRAFLQEAS